MFKHKISSRGQCKCVCTPLRLTDRVLCWPSHRDRGRSSESQKKFSLHINIFKGNKNNIKYLLPVKEIHKKTTGWITLFVLMRIIQIVRARRLQNARALDIVFLDINFFYNCTVSRKFYWYEFKGESKRVTYCQHIDKVLALVKMKDWTSQLLGKVAFNRLASIRNVTKSNIEFDVLKAIQNIPHIFVVLHILNGRIIQLRLHYFHECESVT